ncbi:MAG: SDR family oxidoreductase [Myxococcota bacterium]|nr:SDR family oxidoreductase [Myxococcota bacterium]
MILEGKTVVVCGVGTGLGSEVARVALRDGASLMLAARTESTLQQVAKELDPEGQRVAWQATDITDADQCRALAEATVERFGGVDALVQVAALDTVFGSFRDAKPDDWRSTFEVNVVGTALVVQALAPHMKQRGGGSVVLVGSQSSLLPADFPQAAYASSKGALMSAMLYMAKDLGPDRIRVNTVIPTWMWGPPVEMFVKMQAKQLGVPGEEVVEGITSKMAIPEIPADEDVAEACIFFCSDRAKMITGQSLLVNCGELMP